MHSLPDIRKGTICSLLIVSSQLFSFPEDFFDGYEFCSPHIKCRIQKSVPMRILRLNKTSLNLSYFRHRSYLTNLNNSYKSEKLYTSDYFCCCFILYDEVGYRICLYSFSRYVYIDKRKKFVHHMTINQKKIIEFRYIIIY